MNALRRNLNSYLGMTKRNILVFFKDKTTLFFSMLAPLIVFFLYIVFLKDTYLSGLKDSVVGLEEYIKMSDIENIANAWLLSGLLGTTCITVSLNSLNVMVSDKNAKIDYDYNSSPVKGYIVVLSYFTGAFLNTFLITASILTIGLVVLEVIGGLYLNFQTIIFLYLVTILGCASSTIVMMVIVSFFKKLSSLQAFSGIVSAAIGFIIGAYIPLGNFSSVIQGILSLVPGSHVACLYRNLLMTGILEHIDISLAGADSHMFIHMAQNTFALNLNMFSYNTTKSFMMIYTSISIILALGLNIVLYKKTIKRY